MRILLNKEFVKTGILSIEWGWFYGDLFNKRQESDYKDIKRFKREDIETLIPKTEEFVALIKSLIHN